MWRILPLLLLFIAGTAFATEDDESWRIQMLNERYDDFFARRRAEEEYERTRQHGSGEVRAEREKWDVEMRRAREDYVLNRKPPADVGPALREWTAEHDKMEHREEVARQGYVEILQRIERLEATAKHIPENVEYDLQP